MDFFFKTLTPPNQEKRLVVGGEEGGWNAANFLRGAESSFSAKFKAQNGCGPHGFNKRG